MIEVPPLRERAEDLPVLCAHLLRDLGAPDLVLGAEVLHLFERYPWPGNVRELDNAIARAVVLSEHDLITPDLLALSPWDSPAASGNGSPAAYLDLPYHDSMEEHSIAVIRHALDRADGNQTKAAERLKLQRTYLARLIKQKGIGTSDTSFS